jgi:phytoene synthase
VSAGPATIAGSVSERAADRRFVAERVRASGTSFYLAMRCLPAPRRDALFAIYAFCREVDDIADDVGPSTAERAAGLAAWRRRIDALYDGRPACPITRALAPGVVSFDLRRADFHAVIDGMASDAGAPTRAPSRAELDLYCDRVAGAVGRLSVRAFGVPGEAGDALARHLGRALQLTNILRDLAEDAALGRLYLPRELLRAHGIVDDDPDRVLAHPALPAACAELATEAEADYLAADRLMAAGDARAMRSARIMAAIYRALLRRLARAGWHDAAAHVGARRIRVPRWHKLWLLLRHGLVG